MVDDMLTGLIALGKVLLGLTLSCVLWAALMALGFGIWEAFQAYPTSMALALYGVCLPFGLGFIFARSDP